MCALNEKETHTEEGRGVRRGSKIGKSMKQKSKSTLLADNTRVDNNKTNKPQASCFYSTASHHSSVHKWVR